MTDDDLRPAESSRASAARRTAFLVARILFLAAVVVFAVVSFGPQWDEIVAAIATIPWWTLPVSTAVVVVGILGYATAWRRVLAAYGLRVPWSSGTRIFLIGQLGRYIPGSVWSFGAQAAMLRQAHPRVSVLAGLVTLGYSLGVSTIVGLLAMGVGLLPQVLPAPLAFALAALVVLAISPIVVNRIGSRLAGTGRPLRMTLGSTLLVCALLLVMVITYGVSIALVSIGLDSHAGTGNALGTMIGAFAAAYVVGVVVIFAPAGLGAREAALAFLLAPLLGPPAAAAVALVARIPSTIADFAIAFVFWAALRGRRND